MAGNKKEKEKGIKIVILSNNNEKIKDNDLDKFLTGNKVKDSIDPNIGVKEIKHINNYNNNNNIINNKNNAIRAIFKKYINEDFHTNNKKCKEFNLK